MGSESKQRAALMALDHFVFAAPTLAEGIAAIERMTGVTATAGGQHPGRGTHNALLSLGPRAYLEIVAPDPGQLPQPDGRWLGVDRVLTPQFTTWAASSADLDALVRSATGAGVSLGAIQTGARRRVDGVQLSWRLTNPDPLIADGVVPFFIDWGESPHPASSAAAGLTLIDYWVEHTDVARTAGMLEILGLSVTVRYAARAGLAAVLETPRGRVELR
jgi:Glyoxalase-like domain